MATIERKDLVAAVLASRDQLDPDLDTDLLAAVVDAEADATGDGEAALRAIEAAVAEAIERGVGRTEPTGGEANDGADGSGEEHEG